MVAAYWTVFCIAPLVETATEPEAVLDEVPDAPVLVPGIDVLAAVAADPVAEANPVDAVM